ncbi:hypothetical protein C8T65DRAFT_650887 [Cerioporus squamosus]|nr:hypothetical protein C8T65DRAFT_650887 [Cerioporus squamosus]
MFGSSRLPAQMFGNGVGSERSHMLRCTGASTASRTLGLHHHHYAGLITAGERGVYSSLALAPIAAAV